MNQNFHQDQNGAQWNAPNVQWNSNGPYHSGGQPPKKQKPKTNWKTTIIACACTCAVAVGASIGGTAVLVGSGALSSGNQNTGTSVTSSITSSSASSGTISASANAAVNTAEDDGSIQSAAAKALKSVVLIQAYSESGGTSYGAYYGYSFGGGREEDRLSGEGSGVIATSDGYIITNHHVVSGASSLKVTLPSGETYDAKVVGSDEVSDLALLKIEATNLDAAEFGESGSLQVGDRVMAVGNPGGSEFQSSVTFGYVSALDRTITTSTEYKMTVIQTDAAINPGNSGGALVNSAGQVVGINSSKIVSTEYEGLGFDTALPIINDLREHGNVTNRAALGITGQFIDSMTAQYYNMSQGYYVASVKNNSAAKAGLTKGDIITKIDSTEVTSSGALASYLLTKKPGDTVSLTVDRNGKTVTMEVTLQQFSES